jgi:hypothetical protein
MPVLEEQGVRTRILLRANVMLVGYNDRTSLVNGLITRTGP